MGEAKGVERKELEHIPNGYSRDLLQRFTASASNQIQFGEIKVEDESEEIELNLGLSLGGRFGVDPNESNKLYRSTSIAGLTTLLRENGGSSSAAVPSPVIYPHLDRTTSLQTEEEWRKRKEMQSLRRMEAKRKRSEKQRNLRIGRESRDRSEASGCLEGNGEEKRPDGVPVPPLSVCMGGGSTVAAAVAPKQQQYMVSNGVSSTSFGLQNWAARGSVVGSTNGKATIVPSSPPPPPAAVAAAAQGSAGSQGSRSCSTSGMSEFDSRPVQGSSNGTEARSPASVQSLPEQNETKTTISPTSTTKPTMSPTSTTNGETGVPTNVEGDNASKKPKLMENGMRESGMKVMEEMPCVSTKGDGPNGRKIEGFLYKYKKGEEVRIVCVCHGRFLSPAEFVEHAGGGGDVAHPLRHIVVNPSPSFL